MKIRRAFFFLSSVLSLFLLACAARATAPALPEIPEMAVSANDCGARGDGSTVNTKAIQKAIDTAAKKGGRVTFSEGVYLCGPLQLASHVDLNLPRGVTLRMLPFSESFPSGKGAYLSFISAQDCTDIKISGEGMIDGQGAPWWPLARANKLTLRRPQLITMENCERLLFENFTTLNPPNTHFALRLCKEVTMRGLKLRAPGDSKNTDGLNISGKNYLITKCDISTGDDNIVILTHVVKGQGQPICENFEIRDCTFGEGHGMSIGSYTRGGIRGVLVENCAFNGTTGAIRMKAARDRGGLVENLVYRNITIKGARYPVFISSYYPKEPKTPSLDTPTPTSSMPRWENILIENITVTDSQNSIIIWGLPETPVSGITVRNASFSSQSGATVFNAKNIKFDRVRIDSTKGPALRVYRASVDGMPDAVEVK